LPVEFDVCEFELARWVSADDPKTLDEFVTANGSGIAEDLDGDLVFLARNTFYLGYTAERAPGIKFTDVKDVKKVTAQ
jgi:peptide chain release factor 3